DEPLNPRVRRPLQKVPVKRMIVSPFALLAELAAHEQKLLARMAEHETVIGAQVGKTLPLIARHAADERTLAVHDLVVGERQNEILEESVVQPEQNLTVVIPTID